MSEGKGVILLFFVLLGALPLSVHAQKKSKAQLQREKQKNIEKIKETERILSETAEQKKNSLGELTALNQRINQQESLITSIQSEIYLLDEDIDENNALIEALRKDVEKLKEEYAKMLLSAQKSNGKIERLTFIFSAESFDQLVMRLKYMEQYSKARKDQAQAIEKVQGLLRQQVSVTEMKRNEKGKLLEDELKENTQLASLKQQQRGVLRNLEKEEKKLKHDLDETREAVAELDELIARIVKEEIERAEREAREAREGNAKQSKASETAIALSASFEENKSRFGWPVSGFVSQKFGRQNHPVLKNIVVENGGINIQTKKNEKVKCIFTGEVRSVAIIAQLGNAVIISHGEYLTVYAGLREVFVKRGQKVDTDQEIGTVMVNSEGVSELRFQIRKSKLALDPEAWLKN
jgi:septal ring factor EnvC (AmiA/AmiB activator)